MDVENLMDEAGKKIKHIYHQMDSRTVSHALSLFLAGAGGLTPKELPKNILAIDFMDSLINKKVDIKGEFGLCKMAAMLKTMMLKLFVDELGLEKQDALVTTIQVMTAAIEQMKKFIDLDDTPDQSRSTQCAPLSHPNDAS